MEEANQEKIFIQKNKIKEMRYVAICYLSLILIGCNNSENRTTNTNKKTLLKDTLSFESIMVDLEKHGYFDSEFYDLENKKISGIVSDTFILRIKFRGEYQKILNEADMDVYSRTNNLSLLKKVNNREYQFCVDTNEKEKDFRFEVILRPKNYLFKKRTSNPDVYEYTETLGFFRIVNLY